MDLGSIGAKLEFYGALDTAVKANLDTGFSVTNKIPRYAIKSYKHLGQIAAIIRQTDKNLRTKVQIPSGDQWPTIFTKKAGDRSYGRVSKELFDKAKEIHTQQAKEANLKKKIARDDHLLTEGVELMDSQPSH